MRLQLRHLYYCVLGIMTFLGVVRVILDHNTILIYRNSSIVGMGGIDNVIKYQLQSFVQKHKRQHKQQQQHGPKHVHQVPGMAENKTNNNLLLDDDDDDDDDEVFGACLKIMDDNHWLVEWLAYHYFVLPLRHLVVMVDPKSRTSPNPIFDRWKDRMTIVVVNETYEGAKARELGNARGNKEHLGPQRSFLADCFRRYKKMKWKSWIIATDTDEFVAINPLVRTATIDDPTNSELYREPNIRSKIPSNDVPGSVMKMLKLELQRRKHHPDMEVKWPDCFAMNRMQICTDENATSTSFIGRQQDNNDNNGLMPSGLNLEDFLTERFIFGGNQLRPKDMINIGGIEESYFANLNLNKEKDANTHNVVPGRCAQGAPRRNSVFQAYHYDGTERQRKFRSDPRGQYGKRKGTQPLKHGMSCPKFMADDLRPWLRGFVQLVGHDEAQRLLEGNGRVHSWPKYKKIS